MGVGVGVGLLVAVAVAVAVDTVFQKNTGNKDRHVFEQHSQVLPPVSW